MPTNSDTQAIRSSLSRGPPEKLPSGIEDQILSCGFFAVTERGTTDNNAGKSTAEVPQEASLTLHKKSPEDGVAQSTTFVDWNCVRNRDTQARHHRGDKNAAQVMKDATSRVQRRWRSVQSLKACLQHTDSKDVLNH